jgi:hypothetical protein
VTSTGLGEGSLSSRRRESRLETVGQSQA